MVFMSERLCISEEAGYFLFLAYAFIRHKDFFDEVPVIVALIPVIAILVGNITQEFLEKEINKRLTNKYGDASGNMLYGFIDAGVLTVLFFCFNIAILQMIHLPVTITGLVYLSFIPAAFHCMVDDDFRFFIETAEEYLIIGVKEK